MSRILRFLSAKTFLVLCSFLLISGVAQAATILFPSGGGLGSNVAPTLGKLPVGTSGGLYVPTSTISGPITVTGIGTLATTTTSSINGVIVVDGVHYPKTGAGIQTAINLCASLHGLCGEVYLPAGTYIAPGVTVPTVSNFQAGLFARSGVALIGASATSTILRFTGNAGRNDGINVGYKETDGSALTITNFEVSNMTLDGGAIATSNFGSAIRQNSTVDFNHLTFKNLNLLNWNGQGGIGIGMTGIAGSSKYVDVENIYGNNIKRAVVWFSLVDYLTIDNVIGDNITGDPTTDEGGVVQVESGFAPIIKNVVGYNVPYQILLLGGGTRGIVDGVRGTYDQDGIYLKGYDWDISNVKIQIGSSPNATTSGITYDRTRTPGQAHNTPVEDVVFYNRFSDIWIAGDNPANTSYGIYINASAAYPSSKFTFDDIHIEGTTYAVNCIYCFNYNFSNIQTAGNFGVFQLGSSTANVLSGTSDENPTSYSSHADSNSSLIIQNVFGQRNTFLNASTTNHSTFLGYNAGLYYDLQNTGIGSNGTGNTAMGEGALHYGTTTSNNVAVGYDALRMNNNIQGANNSGSANVAVGMQALLNTTSGLGNSAVGYISQQQNTTGTGNSSLGYQSLVSNISGSGNTGMGREALYNTTASNDTAIGFASLRSNTSGTSNVSIGVNSGYHSTTGTNNTFLGSSAGLGASDYVSTGNTISGEEAGSLLTTGSDYNSMYGFKAGNFTSSGNGNMFFGYFAGQNNTTGFNNIAIGWNALVQNPAAGGQLNLGNMIFGTGLATSTSSATIPASTGNIGIATTSPWRTFDVNGTVGMKGLTVGTGAGALCLTSNNEVVFSPGANCVAAGNFLASSSLSAIYPLAYNSTTGAFTTAFGTTTANTFSQLNTFNGGLIALASSTSGNGAQNGGLTISGGSTTTLNGYFAANVGVGTTSNAGSSQLAVNGTSYFSGNVGVGTTPTSNKLEINGTTHFDAPNTDIMNVLWSDNAKALHMPFTDGSTYDMGILLNATTRELRLYTKSGDSSDLISFYTNNTERARITNNGNFGIGSTSPAFGLSVDKVTGTAATSTISNGSATHPSCMQLYSPNGTAYAVYVSNAGVITTKAGSCN